MTLDRRQEAEAYWLRAVKLRPGYFEAVEHLVGLYCEDHRGREAVQLIEFVERSLQEGSHYASPVHVDRNSSSETQLLPIPCSSKPSENETLDLAWNEERLQCRYRNFSSASYGSSGYAIASFDNGRLLSLIHGKGNMLYALGDNAGAARAFEDAILIGSGKRHLGIRSLIAHILTVVAHRPDWGNRRVNSNNAVDEPILLLPETA